MPDSVSQRQKHAAAKVRVLDKLIGRKDFEVINKELFANWDIGITEWEQNFIGDKKDQVDKVPKRPLTLRQIAIVEQVWDRVSPYCEELEDWLEHVTSDT